MPWYTGFGNHDELDFGVFSGGNFSAFVAAMAVSDRIPVALPKGMQVIDFMGSWFRVIKPNSARCFQNYRQDQ